MAKARKPKKYDFLFKLLLIGDSGTGKPALLYSFASEEFPPTFISTIGIDFKIRNIVVDGQRIKLQIWDTAGQERFRTVTSSYYRGVTGIMLVYDITNQQSFDHIATDWLPEIRRHISGDVSVMLLGNKCHLEDRRQVPKEIGEQMSREHGILFMETSTEGNINTEEALTKITREMLFKHLAVSIREVADATEEIFRKKQEQSTWFTIKKTVKMAFGVSSSSERKRPIQNQPPPSAPLNFNSVTRPKEMDKYESGSEVDASKIEPADFELAGLVSVTSTTKATETTTSVTSTTKATETTSVTSTAKATETTTSVTSTTKATETTTSVTSTTKATETTTSVTSTTAATSLPSTTHLGLPLPATSGAIQNTTSSSSLTPIGAAQNTATTSSSIAVSTTSNTSTSVNTTSNTSTSVNTTSNTSTSINTRSTPNTSAIAQVTLSASDFAERCQSLVGPIHQLVRNELELPRGDTGRDGLVQTSSQVIGEQDQGNLTVNVIFNYTAKSYKKIVNVEKKTKNVSCKELKVRNANWMAVGSTIKNIHRHGRRKKDRNQSQSDGDSDEDGDEEYEEINEESGDDKDDDDDDDEGDDDDDDDSHGDEKERVEEGQSETVPNPV